MMLNLCTNKGQIYHPYGRIEASQAQITRYWHRLMGCQVHCFETIKDLVVAIIIQLPVKEKNFAMPLF